MSGWQPERYDQRRPAVPPEFQRQQAPHDPWQASQQPQYQPAAQPRYTAAPEPRYQAPVQQPQPYSRARKTALTAAETFWYYLGCFPFAAMYFLKIPAKKALSDFGMAEMTAAEKFWYVMMCISFGAGYFAKLPVAKALSEMH